MDLNPDSPSLAEPKVRIVQQDCSMPWGLTNNSLDAVFTSNFFEHLPTKDALLRTLRNAHDALRPGGRLIAMGPNIALVPGAYWDFFDHYIPLTDKSLCEVLRLAGFEIESSRPAFLPFTMSHGRRYPVIALRLYLALPFVWRFVGKQFLVVARKP